MHPLADQAIIDPAKLRDYLLSDSHPVGRFKARFFKALGYEAGAWERLQSDLLAQLQAGEAVLRETSPYGQKFEVGGTLQGPNLRTARIVSVWMVPDGGGAPRFITAYPQ